MGGLFLRFKDFVSSGKVRKAKLDVSLVKALLATAEKDLVFLESLDVTEFSARKIMSGYYDVLRSLLEAIAHNDGYKVYSHEAFTYFLIEKGNDVMAKKFDRFRKIRNGINYYGEDISVEEVRELVLKMKRMIQDLKKNYLK